MAGKSLRVRASAIARSCATTIESGEVALVVPAFAVWVFADFVACAPALVAAARNIPATIVATRRAFMVPPRERWIGVWGSAAGRLSGRTCAANVWRPEQRVKIAAERLRRASERSAVRGAAVPPLCHPERSEGSPGLG